MKIFEVAELAHRQMFPSSGDDTIVSLAELERTAISEYAYQMLLYSYQQKRDEGAFELPGYLTSSIEKPVVKNTVDISNLGVFKSLPNESWLLGVYASDKSCGCKFIKSTFNRRRILCDDDSLDESTYPFYVLADKIIFENKPPVKTVNIVYANTGQNVDGDMDIDDAMAALIRRGLMDIYLGKVGKNDETLNDNATI